MTKKLQILTIVTLFLNLNLFAQQEDPNVVGGNSDVKMKFKKIKLPKKRQSIQTDLQNREELIPIDDPIDPIDPPTTTTYEAGSTEGKFSVSLTGAANYSVPIMIPPGIKGVAPNIGINHSSQGSNGLLGWGWNLSGLSTITRSPASKYYDNKYDGIDFKDDRFSFDGQRLILKSGTYGVSGSVYQTENYSNLKVVAYGTSPYGSSYGPSYFIVYYPNGTRAWYGNSGNSRSRLEWALFRWQDVQGNYIDYNYQSDNELLSIKTIKYGGKIGGTAPMNQIDFTYVTRNRPELIYIGDYLFKRTNLLKRIIVKGSGVQYRKYELNYAQNSLGYQKLISLQEFNKNNKSLSPITFNYGNTTPGFKGDRNEVKMYPGFDYKKSALISGEFDGDGKTDVVFYNKTRKDTIYLFTDLYDQSYSLGYRIKTGGFSDIFGSNILSHNGKILHQQGITFIKESSNTSSSSSSSVKFRTFAQAAYGPVHQYDKTWSAPKYRSENYCNNSSYYNIPKKYLSGDFNGDGLTDVIAIEKPYTTRYCNPRDCDDGGGGIGIEYKASKKQKESNSARLPIEAPSCCDCNSYTNRSSRVYFIDLDRRKTSNFSKTSGYFRKPIGTKDKILTADYNGDGRQDILHFQEGKLYIYTLDINNNLKFLHEETDNTLKLDYPVLFGDYNGDGKTDFLIPTANNSSNWRYFISKGKSFYKQTKNLGFNYVKDYRRSAPFGVNVNGVLIQNPWYDYRYVPQDMNGDGKTDIVLHNVIAPYSAYDRSVEYISIYKNTQSISDPTPSFSLETRFTKNNGGVNKFGMPIFLESNMTNGNLEYGYVSVNHIYAYELRKDTRVDMTLNSITNNGVKTSIDYERLGIAENQYGYQTYTGQYGQDYPFVNVNKSPSFKIVKKVTQEGAGIKKYQDYLYHGAVSHVNLGFQGFLKTKRTNWYGNGVSKLWTISKHAPSLRGAVVEQWLSTSSYEGSNYMSKTTNTYSSNLASNKVFTLKPTKLVQHNALNGTTTTKNITYDSYKNPLTESIVYNGGSKQMTYTYANNPGTNSQNYYIGRITKKEQTNTIGGNSFTTTEEYSYGNNLVTQQKVKGNGTAWNTESFLYDTYGNVTKKTLSASGITARVENFKYDATGRFMIESIDVEGLKTKFTYDSFGNPLTTTNPYNQTTIFTYDGWNRLKSEKNYLGHTSLFTYTRLSNGGVRKKSDYPKGVDEIVEHNIFGWLTKSSVLGLNNKWTHKSFQYDVAGRKIKESEPYFSYPSQWNTVSYDNYGREITRTSFNGLVANITYSGLTTTVDDGTKTVKTTKDGDGNVVKMEDPGGTITYQYHGNKTMKSANYGGRVVSTEIDGWGRKTKLIDPAAGTYTYSFNNVGELLEETTPKGSTRYTYDAYGKISTKVLNGDETNMSLSYSYNSTTKLISSIQGNNARTGESYTYNYTYDSQKRPYITKETNGKAYFEHKVTRDSYGRVDSETYTSRNNSDNVSSIVKVKNIYDRDAGILKEIRDFNSNSSLWKLNEVNERGQTKQVLLGNGIVKKRTYDQFGFLTKIHDLSLNNSASTALNLEYTFDAVRGNLNSRKNNNFSWNENFTYDNLNRLTNISGAVTRNQEYDNRGRITKNSTLGNYVYTTANSYRLKEVDLNTQGDFHYRNNPIQNVKYNAYKKPVSITSQDKGRVDFEYGLLQNRSHAYYGGEQEDKLQRRFQKHYSAITPVEIEVDSEGNTKIITYIGGDAYSAPVVHIKQTASGSANGYHYLHRDYLNSILAISDSSGTIKEQRQFGAWGDVDRYKTGNSEIAFAHDSTLINRGYTGHEHFFEVGLIHMNGRMYDASLGRFLSPDNYIQEPFSTQSFNRYGYVWNNPLKYIDPSGEFIFTLIGAIVYGAIVGAAISAVVYAVSALITGNWSWSDFGKSILFGAIGGAISGGLSAAGGLLTSSAIASGGTGAFWQSTTFNLLSEFASQAGASLAMGDSVTWGTAIGSIAGGLIGGKLPKWRGVKGGWLKNALGEIGFNSARGAITGSVSGGVSAAVDGENIGNGIARGARNGAIGGASQSIAMIATFGATYKPTDDQLKYANQMARAHNMSTNDVSWRKGGIYQGIMSLLKNKREVTWGNNVATYSTTDADTFGHEFGHIIQVQKQGWAQFQAKGIYEQLILGHSAYGKFGTNEYGAEKYLHPFGGCSNGKYCPVH